MIKLVKIIAMVKRVSFLLVLLLFFQKTNAQDVWDYKFYDSINHTDFREYSIFYQKVNFSKPDYALINSALFYLTNEIRIENDRKPLDYHKALEISSYHHSKEMVEKKFFSHINSKTKKRRNTGDRARLAGINNPFIAENIAYNYISNGETYLDLAEKIMNQWMNSPGHRANILSENALQLGCGAFFKDQYIYATQNFQWYCNIFEKDAEDKLPDILKGNQTLKKVTSE
ncbi:MAG: CAP domain-containing protein [Bacteroidetes bacterium]|nr:CAP domain-containing protein [Bacteroidota bacterium]